MSAKIRYLACLPAANVVKAPSFTDPSATTESPFQLFLLTNIGKTRRFGIASAWHGVLNSMVVSLTRLLILHLSL